ncbi:MAG: dihydroxy-acid dehydratase [Balneolaceae bacterium]|nr:dihydroxy-acid dehydratase [Balneolaceae bacterium]
MSLPFSSSIPATNQKKLEECDTVGKAILNLLEKDLKPKDIITKRSLENADYNNRGSWWIDQRRHAYAGHCTCCRGTFFH